MATTTNFGWETPDDTDLVKDGAAAIRTALGGVDTSFVDLKGGTSGQLLSKASNTDLDYTWVNPSTGDITGVSVTSPITGGGTSGDVTIGIASSAVVPSQTGNSGKYLTTDGTTSSWGTISAGSLTQLATGTLSGTQVQLSSISGSYKNLYLVLRDLTFSSSAAKPQLKFNNTSTEAALTLFRSNTTTPYQTNSGQFWLAGSSTNNMTATTADNNFAITIYDYAQTAAHKGVFYCGTYRGEGDGSWQGVMGGGGVRLTGAITSLELTMDGTITFSGGTYILFGVN